MANDISIRSSYDCDAAFAAEKQVHFHFDSLWQFQLHARVNFTR